MSIVLEWIADIKHNSFPTGIGAIWSDVVFSDTGCHVAIWGPVAMRLLLLTASRWELKKVDRMFRSIAGVKLPASMNYNWRVFKLFLG